ncbi:hypothetical protein [Salsuginibacillus kocurii]|nr:hypothetical protein [Salsuginibacillus kocurii]
MEEGTVDLLALELEMAEVMSRLQGTAGEEKDRLERFEELVKVKQKHKR